MTRKHFQALADNLRACRPNETTGNFGMIIVWNTCVHAVATACHAQNVGFKPERFYEACGGLFEQ